MDMKVSLRDDVAAFVEAKVSKGEYESATDVINDAVRLLGVLDGSDEAAVRALRDAWDEGVASGDAGEIDFHALKAEARARGANCETIRTSAQAGLSSAKALASFSSANG